MATATADVADAVNPMTDAAVVVEAAAGTSAIEAVAAAPPTAAASVATMAVPALHVKYVSSVSELGLDTPAYPAYLTVTRLLTYGSVSSVSETEADTLCIWRIWGPHPAYLTCRSMGWQHGEVVGVPPLACARCGPFRCVFSFPMRRHMRVPSRAAAEIATHALSVPPHRTLVRVLCARTHSMAMHGWMDGT